MVEAFSALGPTLYVNPERLAQMGVMDNAASIDEGHPAWVRFLSWLDEQDQRHDFVAAAELVRALMFVERFARDVDEQVEALEP